jgi:hypothetical protein
MFRDGSHLHVPGRSGNGVEGGVAALSRFRRHVRTVVLIIIIIIIIIIPSPHPRHFDHHIKGGRAQAGGGRNPLKPYQRDQRMR